MGGLGSTVRLFSNSLCLIGGGQSKPSRARRNRKRTLKMMGRYWLLNHCNSPNPSSSGTMLKMGVSMAGIRIRLPVSLKP